jgi:hypothetical protein
MAMMSQMQKYHCFVWCEEELSYSTVPNINSYVENLFLAEKKPPTTFFDIDDGQKVYQ